jgi:hypothetical protein
MNIWRATNLPIDATRRERSVEAWLESSFDQQRRAQVREMALGLWSAAKRKQLDDYLDPIPLTHLYAAQRAFREIGAHRVANILRSGVFSLTRVGAPVPLSQVVNELTVLLAATTEDVDGLIARFSGPQSRNTPDTPAMCAVPEVRGGRRVGGGNLPPA